MPRQAINPDKWKTNSLNFSEAVTKDWQAPTRIGILDSTVRKITGTAGAKYSPGDIAELTQLADRVGVRWIEVNLVHGNMPSTQKLRDTFKAIASKSHSFMLVGTAFRDRDTIDHAIDNGADAVAVSTKNIGRENLDELREWHEYVTSKGVKVAGTMGARIENLTASEVSDRINILALTDVEYIGIHENTGATSPDAWRYLMKEVHRSLPRSVPVVPHIHNMYGQGSMAAVNAVLGGCQGLDLAINGIAIHCGLPALEEAVATLEILYGVETGIDMSLLREYSQLLERLHRLGVHPNKAITGREAFLEELEPFVKEVLEAREQGTVRLHGFNPGIFGGEFYVAWGENTVHGEATEVKLRQMGLPHDATAVQRMVSALEAALADKESRDDYPYYLLEDEFEALARDVFASEVHRG